MRSRLISLAAAVMLLITLVPVFVAYAAQGTDSISNAIDISESFDKASSTGNVVYTGSSKNYTWNILATADFGYATGGAYVPIPDTNKVAVSLTKNSDNNGTKRTILTIPDGAGGIDKDIDLSFDAGVCYGFSQSAKVWNLVFSSSSGEEMFSLQLRNGENATEASLLTGADTLKTDYTFTNAKFTNLSASVSFNEGGGGRVTLGNVSANFDKGVDISEIALISTSTSDQNRPFVIDNFKMQTYDKVPVNFNVTSSGEDVSVSGAELYVDSGTYTLDDDGILVKYFRHDTQYPYTVRLRNHEIAEGEFTAFSADKYIDTYTFSNVEARRPTLIHAYYDEESGRLVSVSAQSVSVRNKKYTVEGERREGYNEKYFLWNSEMGLKPYAAAQVSEGVSDTNYVELKYHDTVSPDKITLTGGNEYIYIPQSGYADTEAVTAEVYDNLGFPMRNAVIDWSLPEETSSGIGIMNGVVTVAGDYEFKEALHTVKIRAQVHGTQVYAEKNLEVRKVSDVGSFEITGPAVIKNGTEAQYMVSHVKNIYGEEIEAMPEFTLMADSNGDSEGLNISGLTIAPNIDLGDKHEKQIKITVTLNGTDKKVEKTVTVYDYDFYEPGIGTASYGEPRMEIVDGENSIVWPASQTGSRTTEIPFPKPVELKPGSCKIITFDNFALVNYVGSQERSLHFTNSDGIDVISLDFSKGEGSGANGAVLNNWRSGNPYSGDIIGEYTLNQKSSAVFTLRTDTDGITSLSFWYNGKETQETVLGMVYDIARIRLRGSTSAPNDRLLSLTNIKITDGDAGGVEIAGGDKVAVVYGADAKKEFAVKVFNIAENESFTWSVADKDGNEIEGVTIDREGVLTVSDSVKTLIDATEDGYVEAVVKYTGTEGHSAQQNIKIMDYASVSSVTITGPENIEAGTESASYSVTGIVDEYGNKADMQTAYMITTGEEIADIDTSSGSVVLAPSKTGTFTVTAAVGNPGKTRLSDLKVTVAKYSETGDSDGDSTDVDVRELVNYSVDTKYLVTTAKADGTIVDQTEESAKDGIITVNTADADRYEVSPIYAYTNVGDVSEGKTIPVCDGIYDFTFKKANSTRADIFVNGFMVGQNVDQVSIQRTSDGGSEYTASDIKVEGGKAVVTMKDNTSDMDSITVRKAPSIVNRKPHVYLLGDSLVSAYYGKYDSTDENGVPLPGTGQTGWGEVLHNFLSDDMIVTNLAESGSAAATLYATTFSGVIQNAEKGDYLIMETGYQDEPNSTLEMMKSAVRSIYDECRRKGVELILVTPNCAAHGTTNIETILKDGGVRFGPELMKLADELGILGIDLSGSSGIEINMLLEFGEEYWLNNFNLVRPEDKVPVDRLHSSYWGAVLHAANIATAIDEAQNREIIIEPDTEPGSEPETEPVIVPESGSALKERLAGLKLKKDAEPLIMTDSNGDEIRFKIGWYEERGTAAASSSEE